MYVDCLMSFFCIIVLLVNMTCVCHLHNKLTYLLTYLHSIIYFTEATQENSKYYRHL